MRDTINPTRNIVVGVRSVGAIRRRQLAAVSSLLILYKCSERVRANRVLMKLSMPEIDRLASLLSA